MKTIKLFFYTTIIVTALIAAQNILKEVLLMYQNNTLKENVSAVAFLESQAIQGDVNASFLLAIAYSNGKAGRIDIVKAMHWYKVSAKHGDADAMLMLGWLYYNESKNLELNLKKARYWFRLAASNGVEEAVEMLRLLGQ